MAEVRITAWARPRVLLFLMSRPAQVEVDFEPIGDAPWGRTTVFEVPAGDHQLTVSFTHQGRRRTGEATIDVHLADGQVVDVEYTAPWITLLRGSLKVIPAPATT